MKANFALGLLYGMAGRYDAQLELALEDFTVVDRLGSRMRQGDAVRTAALRLMRIAGNYEDGLHSARRSFDLSHHTNSHQLMHGTYSVMSALYELGRWDEIPPLLDCISKRSNLTLPCNVTSYAMDRSSEQSCLPRAVIWAAPVRCQLLLVILWLKSSALQPDRRSLKSHSVSQRMRDRSRLGRQWNVNRMTALLERALSGFDALKAGAEGDATRQLLCDLTSSPTS